MSNEIELLDPDDDTFTVLNEKTGLLEVLSTKTGEVLAVQTSPEDLYQNKKDRMVRYEIGGKEIWVENTIDLDLLPSQAFKVQYSKTLVDLICQKIVEGQTLKAICEEPGFPPYHVLAKWRRNHPYCQESIEQARQDRAEWLVEEARELVDTPQPMTGDELKKVKEQVEIRKWTASKEAPTKYGNKVELTGKQPVQFFIETGIRRADDENFKVDETAKLKDVDEQS